MGDEKKETQRICDVVNGLNQLLVTKLQRMLNEKKSYAFKPSKQHLRRGKGLNTELSQIKINHLLESMNIGKLLQDAPEEVAVVTADQTF